MYIVNIESIPKDKVYECNGVIANWLMTVRHIPLLGKGKNDGRFYFAKTKDLEEAIKNIPFIYNLSKIFS